jgi:hypothetical protein
MNADEDNPQQPDEQGMGVDAEEDIDPLLIEQGNPWEGAEEAPEEEEEEIIEGYDDELEHGEVGWGMVSHGDDRSRTCVRPERE